MNEASPASPSEQALSMRAWLSVTPGLAGIELSETPLPVSGPGTALVRVEAAAINFSDLLMMDDRYQIRPPRPFIPGQEIAGTVVSAAGDCALAVGDRVASKVEWGGFAEHAVVREDMAIPIPPAMSACEAAALPVAYTTALVALLESTTVKPGETVLVLAAGGGVGLATVQLAKHLEARVIAAAGAAEKCALARAHGADATVDYRAKDWTDRIRAMTGGRGVDIIVDPVGGEIGEQALRLLGWGGRLLVVGFSSGKIPQIPANRLLLRRASAIGVYWNHDRDGPLLRRLSHRMLELCAAGVIRPCIGAVFGFEDLPCALVALRERKTAGKAILSLRRETT